MTTYKGYIFLENLTLPEHPRKIISFTGDDTPGNFVTFSNGQNQIIIPSMSKESETEIYRIKDVVFVDPYPQNVQILEIWIDGQGTGEPIIVSLNEKTLQVRQFNTGLYELNISEGKALQLLQKAQ